MSTNIHPPTGTVTFLFTDIEGSTRLAQELPENWESMREQHNTILRGAIESQSGYVFRIIGDAFCAAFPTAGDALRAALNAQVELHAWSENSTEIKVRMGIHTGKAEIQEDGEYVGYLTLTRVQRVMSAAYGGQILLSKAAAELVRNELPQGTSLLDMREHRLKGLPTPEQLWQVAAPGLTQDFPPLQTLADIPGNLPIQLTSFVGREKEIAALQEDLEAYRLVTLTGPGGIGKTRLSLELAGNLVHNFRHGVWYVELAHVSDPALVAATIAHVFNLYEGAGRRSADTLIDYLRDKELLLILDNFEQVIDAAMLVKEILLFAPRLKVIVTSRTPLRIAGEYEFRVPLLPLPPQEHLPRPEELAQLGAVQLFVERARSAKANFAMTTDNAPAVAEICSRLDGLPLAIELAAARVRVLPPQKMLPLLDNRLKFLTSSARDLPARQKTLRGAIGWSYDLLSPTEQRLFRRLAVFAGGGTLEAIEQVCDIGDDLDLLTRLESLLDKSLIRQIPHDDEARYEMLATIRDYAAEVLTESGEANRIKARHLMYFHGMGVIAETKLIGRDELEWFIRLTNDHDNLNAAVLWGLEHDLEKAVEMLCDLTHFWSRGGHNDEAIPWLREALTKLERTEPETVPLPHLRLRARALAALGILSLQQGYPEAEALLRESVVLLRQVQGKSELVVSLALLGYLGDMEAAHESITVARGTGNESIVAYSLIWLSQSIRLSGGDLQLARRCAAEGAELSQKIGSVWSLARTSLSRGQIAIELQEFGEARTSLKECLALFSESHDRYHGNLARIELANVERWQGNYTEALKLYQAAILVWQDLGLQAAIAHQLECLAMTTAAQGHSQQAARLAGAAHRLRGQTEFGPAPDQEAEYHENLTAIREQLTEARFNALLAEGQAMTTSQAIDFATSLPEITT